MTVWGFEVLKTPIRSCLASVIRYFTTGKSFYRPKQHCSWIARLLQPRAAGILSPPLDSKRFRQMKREVHRWYSHRLGLEMGVVVYGHWGSPLVGFPTSAGDEFELEGQSMIGALADFIDGGKLKFYSLNSINGLSFYNKGAHPFHRSYVQSVFASYFREEVV